MLAKASPDYNLLHLTPPYSTLPACLPVHTVAAIMAGLSPNRVIWKDWNALWFHLGFESLAELEEFIRGVNFAPFFTELNEAVILPEQEEAALSGKPRKRGPNLREVENAMIQGEKAGLARYSKFRVNKKDWKIIDHYAYYLFAVRAANEGSADGMLFGKALSDKEKNERCWWLQLRLAYDMAPSRLNMSRGGKLMSPTQLSAEKKKPLSSTKPPPSILSFGITSQSKPASTNNPLGDIPFEDDPFRDNLTQGSSGEAFTGPSGATSEATSEAITQATTTGATTQATTTGATTQATTQATTTQAATTQATTQATITQATTEVEDSTGLSNAERMHLERLHSTLDLRDRWWQYAVVHEILKSIQNNFVVEYNHMYADDRLTNAMSVQWEKQLRDATETDRIGVEPFTDECAAEYDEQQIWMNSLNLQRKDHDEACTMLNIVNPSVPRIPGMPISTQLTFWQPVAIKAICDFAQSPYLRGGIIADVVGLGKTWMVIGYLLHVSYLSVEGFAHAHADC